MTTKRWFRLLVITVLFTWNLTTSVPGEEKESGKENLEDLLGEAEGDIAKDAEEDADPLEKAIELGAGVHRVRLDKKGNVETCVIIGTSTITQALSPSKALDIANRRARVDSVRQFVRWRNEDVNVYEVEENEYLLAEEGSAADKALSVSESAKSISKGSDRYESSAKALIRGMELIGRKQDAKNRTLYLVYGWSAENAAAAKNISSKSPKDRPKNSGGSAKSKIEDKTVISSRAKKYLKKD